MNTKLKLVLLFIAMAGVMISCKQNTKKQKVGFVLNGTINGMTTGKVVLSDFSKKLSDTISVVDGKFQYVGNYPEPKMVGVEIIHPGFYHMSVFAENTNFTLKVDVKDPMDLKIIGGKAQADMNLSRKWYKDKVAELGMDEIYKEMGAGNLSEKRRKEIEAIQLKLKEERKAQDLKFVKQFPESYYSLTLVRSMCHGVKVDKIEELLAYLSPKLANATSYKELKTKIEGMKNSDIGLKDFIKNASNVSYKIEKSFAGKEYKGVVYLAKLKNDNLCALKKDGTVLTINAKGKQLAKFKAEVKGYASAISTDEADNVYVLDVQEKMEKKKIRGRVVQIPTPVGVVCTVYSPQGKELRHFNCSENITAGGAKCVDGNLIVSDCKKGKIAFYDANKGNLITKLDGMRPCCGMLDFALNGQNQLVVANLGAFRVQCIDIQGKKLMTFGNRGKSLDEFHGCCNPVAVASLSNGAIVTVEKDPTRVKIFSKDGAKQIQGIEELVKGCSYIPMTVDSKDNLYLASGEKGIMKCVAIN